jgi:K+-sensing histidine kinase KdpD
VLTWWYRAHPKERPSAGVGLQAKDVLSGLLEAVRRRQATHLVLPHRETGGFKRVLERPLVDRLIERLPEVEVHVVGTKPSGR